MTFQSMSRGTQGFHTAWKGKGVRKREEGGGERGEGEKGERERGEGRELYIHDIK